MAALAKDLGCFDVIKVPTSELAATQHVNGILFVWLPDGQGCRSALGKAPGYTLNLDESYLRDQPATWQIISLESTCGGNTAATVQHEVLHALGVSHEHNRPDRDQYLNYYASNAQMTSPFEKLTDEVWLDSGSQFEVESIMTYCSGCMSINSATNPVLTLKNGDTFESGERLTTSDALQLQWRYCKDRANFEYKETFDCTSTDVLGFNRKVFSDRLCDGKKDCADGEDELGGIANCQESQLQTENNCCGTLSINGVDCARQGTFYGADYYVCADDPNHVIFKSSNNWYIGNTGIPTGSWGFKQKKTLATGDTSICPPLGAWSDCDGCSPSTIYVFCKSSFDSEDDCIDNNCAADATCIDKIGGFDCACNDGFNGDGVECTEIVRVDECTTDRHNCHTDATCTDTVSSFTCSCNADQVDLDKNNPGTICTSVDTCCKKFTLSVNGGRDVAECSFTEELLNKNVYDCPRTGGINLNAEGAVVYHTTRKSWKFITMQGAETAKNINNPGFSQYSTYGDAIPIDHDKECPVPIGNGNDKKIFGFDYECIEYFQSGNQSYYSQQLFFLSYTTFAIDDQENTRDPTKMLGGLT